MVKSHISEAESERSRPAPLPVQPQMIPQATSQVIPQVVPQVQIAQQVYPTSGFERHIISRVLPNRRSYVLKLILDLAAENRFSTKEIESILVDEKRLCGRTSFYAYLKELKYRGQISSANIDERSIIVSTGSKPQQVQKTFDEIVENLDRSG
jgi:hypothetical protein